MIADRGHDHDKYRRELWRRGVKLVIARRCADHGSGLGRERWVMVLVRLAAQPPPAPHRWERDAGLH